MNDNDMIKIVELIDIEGLYNISEYDVPKTLDAKLIELAGLADRKDRRKRNCIKAAVFFITMLLSVNIISIDFNYEASEQNTVYLGAEQSNEKPDFYELRGGEKNEIISQYGNFTCNMFHCDCTGVGRQSLRK